jgi:hypothetical protein
MVASLLMAGLMAGYLIAAGSLLALLRSYGWLRQVGMLLLGVGG